QHRPADPAQWPGDHPGRGVLGGHRPVLRLLPGAQGFAAGSDRGAAPVANHSHRFGAAAMATWTERTADPRQSPGRLFFLRVVAGLTGPGTRARSVLEVTEYAVSIMNTLPRQNVADDPVTHACDQINQLLTSGAAVGAWSPRHCFLAGSPLPGTKPLLKLERE